MVEVKVFDMEEHKGRGGKEEENEAGAENETF